ncbi:MAG: LysR family transcriptional regulator, partial [Microcystis sp. 53602_E8]|nr:LysR family transcriptional regulator [Microcystis sp. 53602_E8]
ILDVQDFPIQRHWYVVYPKDKKLSVIAKTFLDYLLNIQPQSLLKVKISR